MKRAITLCPHCGVLAGELHKDDCQTQGTDLVHDIAEDQFGAAATVGSAMWTPPWPDFKPQDAPGSGRILSPEDSNLSESDTLLSRDDSIFTPVPFSVRNENASCHREPEITQQGNLRDADATDSPTPTIMLGTDHEWTESATPVEKYGKFRSSGKESTQGECDIDEPVNIPLEEQVTIFYARLTDALETINDMLESDWDDIVLLAEMRLRQGYKTFGSTMYGWDRTTRHRNVAEELADALVYLSSGPVE